MLSHQSADVVLHIVEGLLQGSFSREQSLGGKAKRVIAIANRLLHQEGTTLQVALMAQEEIDDASYDEENDTYYIYVENGVHIIFLVWHKAFGE